MMPSDESIMSMMGDLGEAPSAPAPCSAASRAERERWIRRFIGLFGEPGCLAEYRAGRIDFRTLYDAGMRMAEMMIAEAQGCHSCAFEDEQQNSVLNEPYTDKRP